MTAHYQMPAWALAERPRLDRVLRETVSDWLAEALEREGFGGSELICLRRVYSRIRIRLAASDDSIAAQWALSVAAAVRLAVESGSADVVRYRSRASALADLVERSLEGDLSRVWAWRQLGLTRSSSELADSVELIIEALRSEPGFLVSMMAHFAGSGRLPVLLTKLPEEDWRALAALAWKTAGDSPLPVAVFEGWEGEPILERHAESVIRRSTILRAFRDYAGRRASGRTWAAAIFAALECVPALARWESKDAQVVLAIVAKISAQAPDLSRATATPAPEALRTSGQRSSQQADAIQYESRFGGLMLVLQLFAQLDLFPLLAEEFPLRTLSWTLQQLALRLVSARETDPAVLAFSGIAPTGTSPAQGEPVVTEEEEGRLDGLVENIIGELEARLSGLKLTGGKLVQLVCHRWCRIDADPGWFQIHFSLSDVSTDIRRAALDLDPGYIRALGVTVVFRYE
jgi:hypothetical protein